MGRKESSLVGVLESSLIEREDPAGSSPIQPQIWGAPFRINIRPRGVTGLLPNRYQSPLVAAAVKDRVKDSAEPIAAAVNSEPTASTKTGVAQFVRLVVGTVVAILQNFASAFSASLPIFSKVSLIFVQLALNAAVSDKHELSLPMERKADLTPFLQPVGVAELQKIRKLSALAALTYKPWLVNATSLKRRLKMDLVNSSWAIKGALQLRIDEEPRPSTERKVPDRTGPKPDRKGTGKGKKDGNGKKREKRGTRKDNYLKFSFLEWFSCDEPSTNTRYFVIMGSDTVDHWRLNLSVDPVTFEDPSLGVKIHEGAYEAAKALYARFLPSIKEYLTENPTGKICFTGHSIGGSMATALMLMCICRGELKIENIADVYTFGVPSVFLEGESCFSRVLKNESFDSSGAIHDHATSCEFETHCELCNTGPTGVLEALGLPESIIRNVIMAYDFVPRAFTTDYENIAILMRAMGGGLQEHSQLGREGRKHLFFYVGKVLVMQPDSSLCFVNNEAPHPMLPAKPMVWDIVSPNLDVKYRPPHIPLSSMDEAQPPMGTFIPASSAEALCELMDTPHVLEMFNDPRQLYGSWGGISRYHNPEHYTKGFGRAILYMKGIEAKKKKKKKTSEASSVR
eukprot:gene17749-24109_t